MESLPQSQHLSYAISLGELYKKKKDLLFNSVGWNLLAPLKVAQTNLCVQRAQAQSQLLHVGLHVQFVAPLAAAGPIELTGQLKPLQTEHGAS